MNKQRRKMSINDYEKYIGDTYGYLTIKEFYPKRPDNDTRYDNLKNTIWCRCECNGDDGNNHDEPISCVFPWYMIRSGYINSCGCMTLANFRKMVKERMTRLTYKDKTLTIEEWAKETGLSVSCIRHRMKAGKPTAEVLNPKTNARGTKIERGNV